MTISITDFYWVRHAPVKAVMPGRIYGQRDVGCSLKDKDALKKCAAQLPDDGVWVTSTLSRTKKTATALGKIKGHAVRCEGYRELMEQNFGLWQSKCWDELDEDPEAAHFWQDPAGTCPPDGESFTQVCKRVAHCTDHLARKYDRQTLICVTHAGTIRAALAQALDLSPAVALRFKIDTLSVCHLQRIAEVGKPTTWAVLGINR